MEKIGQGGQASVYRAIQRSNGQIVAIKCFFQNFFQDLSNQKRIFREINILKSLNHRKIIKLLDFYVGSKDNQQDFESVYLILDYMEHDLSQVIKDTLKMEKKPKLNKKIIKNIIYQLLEALAYLEQKGVVHRDIKPSNILINMKTLDIKICDFGLSRSIIKDHNIDFPWKQNNKRNNPIETILSKFNGTLQYRAPEILLLNDSYDMRIDVWGAGCVLAELLGAIDKESMKGPLFYGKSCYPLQFENKVVLQSDDQLVSILKILGTQQSKLDLSFIEKDSAKTYLQNFEDYPPISFEILFPNASKNILKFLNMCLQFSPHNRSYASFLKQMNICNISRSSTKRLVKYGQIMRLKDPLSFDFELPYIVKDEVEYGMFLDCQDLRLLFWEEFCAFHKLVNDQKKEFQVLIYGIKKIKKFNINLTQIYQ